MRSKMNERFEKYVNNKLGSIDCRKAKRLKENWPVWSFQDESPNEIYDERGERNGMENGKTTSRENAS